MLRSNNRTNKGNKLNQMTKIYLVRHASPDWDRKDIPYDIHPGPPLSPKGEQEAEAAAAFLKEQGIVKIYYSPFERSTATAQIIAARNQIPAVEEARLAEWREAAEKKDSVRERMWSVFDEIVRESAVVGPVALVSHGGPITFLLLSLGMQEETLSVLKQKFDGFNPLPPAGAWLAEWNTGANAWNLDLMFTP